MVQTVLLWGFLSLLYIKNMILILMPIVQQYDIILK